MLRLRRRLTHRDRLAGAAPTLRLAARRALRPHRGQSETLRHWSSSSRTQAARLRPNERRPLHPGACSSPHGVSSTELTGEPYCLTCQEAVNVSPESRLGGEPAAYLIHPSHDTGVRHFSCGWAVDFRMCFAAGVRGSAARCSWPAMLTVISCRGRKARMIFFRLSPVSSCR